MSEDTKKVKVDQVAVYKAIVEYEKNLKGEYLEVYKEIIKELNVEEIKEMYMIEIKNDLIDMLVSAQEDGVPADKVVGDNIREFCTTISSDYRENLSLVFKIYRFLGHLFFSVGSMSLARMLTEGSGDVVIDFMFIASILVITISSIIAKNITLKKKFSNKRRRDYLILEFGILIGMLAIAHFILEELGLELYLKVDGSLMLFIALIISLILRAKSEKINNNTVEISK